MQSHPPCIASGDEQIPLPCPRRPSIIAGPNAVLIDLDLHSEVTRESLTCLFGVDHLFMVMSSTRLHASRSIVYMERLLTRFMVVDWSLLFNACWPFASDRHKKICRRSLGVHIPVLIP